MKSVADAVSFVGRLQRNAGASSCTFFIRDPIWPGELHLVAMPGVTVPEPMYGFARGHALSPLFCDATKAELPVEDVVTDPRFRDPSLRPPGLPADLRKLYGDFVERERIASMVRFLHLDEMGDPAAVLFVNFRRRNVFSERQLVPLRKAFAKLVSVLPDISAELLASEGPSWLKEVVTMMHTTVTATRDLTVPFEPQDLSVHALRAVGLNESTGVATIHLLNPDENRLELAGSCGDMDFPSNADCASLDKGEGIISWVATRRKSVLLPDVRKGKFRKLYIPLNRRMRSELAVPILAGKDDLIGVLNIESESINYFSHRSIKSVWYAASNIAVVHRLWREDVRYKSLNAVAGEILELCRMANVGRGEAALNGLADLMKRHLGAVGCDTWVRQGGLEFRRGGASYSEIDQPRPGGWTNLLVDNIKRPLWLSCQGVESAPKASYWSAETSEWRDDVGPPAKAGSLPTLNPLVRSHIGHLGLPISIHGKPAGVAWLRYSTRTDAPPPEYMMWAIGLAAQAGLVQECVDRDHYLVDSEAIKSIGSRLQGLFRSRSLEELAAMDSPFVEGHVEYRSLYPSIGGDFYDVVVIDNDTVGLLLGDGTGKGVSGALNMLPLITGFRSFAHDSRYPASVLDRLSRTVGRVGVDGTAAYLVVTRRFDMRTRKQKLWLTVSSAGHQPSILIRLGGGVESIPGGEAQASLLGLLASDHPPIPEQTLAVDAGDLVVMYTDGISEALSVVSEEEPRRQMTALALAHKSPAKIAAAILNQASDGMRMAVVPPDDMVVMVVRLLEMPAAASSLEAVRGKKP
jgi:hypothetical protein